MYIRINKFNLTNKRNFEFKIRSELYSRRIQWGKSYVNLIVKA